MTQYDMVELSFKAEAPEASHVRIPMNAVIRNEKSVWQLDGFYAGKDLCIPVFGKCLKWVKGDFDTLFPVITVRDRNSGNRCHKSRYALLAINQNLFTS